MALYLRYSKNIQEDIERGTSLHLSGLDKNNLASFEEAVEVLGVDRSELIYVEKTEYYGEQYAQVLYGLCAFELESDNIENAIEEARSFNIGSYSAESMDEWHILEASECGDCPEGVLIENITVLYSNS